MLAQDIVSMDLSMFKDKDTGLAIKPKKEDIYLNKGTITNEYYLDLFKNFGGDDILFYRDEIKDGFRLHNLPLSQTLHQDLCLMTQATNFGSLILPKTATEAIQSVLNVINAKIDPMALTQDFHLPRLHEALTQLLPLSRKYHCIVDNPPYMGGGNMNKTLGDFVKDYYPDSKADLMACFMEAGLQMLHLKGFLGMINQHSWMFLSSYEKLREKLIANTCFDTLLHLGARTFPEIGGEVVQNASFVFWNTQQNKQGVYLRLVDFNSSDLKRTKTLEAIEELPFCKWVFWANQSDFLRISGSPIGYWLSIKLIRSFDNGSALLQISPPRQGLATMSNTRFVRDWHEVMLSNENIPFTFEKLTETKWQEYNKGGNFQKWYGNRERIVNWKNNGQEIKKMATDRYNSISKRVVNEGSYFKSSVTWSKIGAGSPSFRLQPEGAIFDVAGMSIFFEIPIQEKYLLGFLNSIVARKILEVLSPTLNFEGGHIGSLPVLFPNDSETEKIINNVDELVLISKLNWDSRETSWDFQRNELIRMKGQDFEESVELYQAFWQKKFFQLHKNEEELNRQFIEIYGLQNELTPDVPLEDITILKEESSIKNGQLVFDMQEIIVQFISYSVGCMFGRYSLDKQGLILANQGEMLEDFLQKIKSQRRAIIIRTRC